MHPLTDEDIQKQTLDAQHHSVFQCIHVNIVSQTTAKALATDVIQDMKTECKHNRSHKRMHDPYERDLNTTSVVTLN